MWRQPGNDGRFLRRANTVFIGELKTVSLNGGPVSKKLSGRPYTDSVLETWTRRKDVKKFHLSLRSSAKLQYECDESEKECMVKQSSLVPLINSTKASSKDLALCLSNTEAKIDLESNSFKKIKLQHEPQDNAQGKMEQQRRRHSLPGNDLDIEQDEVDHTAGSRHEFFGLSEVTIAKKGDMQSNKASSSEANGDYSNNTLVAVTATMKKRQSYDEIELLDITEDENLESIAELSAVAVIPGIYREPTGNDSSPTQVENALSKQESQDSNEIIKNKENTPEDFCTSSDTETEGAMSEVDATEKMKDVDKRWKKPISMIDPKILFARRHWDTLRDRMQRRITVKEVFGQILSPKETSPIVAIANVLLRDQRKYVMRTEWMTSAIIFNRFFTILLVLSVFISLLAVFMQSSRLASFF